MTASAAVVPSRRWPSEAAVVGGAAAVLALVGITGLLSTPEDGGAPVAVTATLALGHLPMGLFIVAARRGHLVGRLLVGVGLLSLTAVAATGWSEQTVLAWGSQWLWWPSLALVPMALLAFPEGRFPPGPRRGIAWLLGLATAGSTTALAVAALDAPRTLLTSGEPAPPGARPWLMIAASGALVVLVLTLVVVVDMVRRARSGASDDAVRSQIRCLVPAGMLLALGIVLDAAGLAYSLVPAAVAFPLGMGLAILRYGVDDLDLVVNRSLVWLFMSGAVLVTFAVTTGLASTAALEDRSLLATAIGTGIIAAGFDPVRRLVQRTVDRLLFGDRDRPHEVVQTLGRRMHQASDPGGMLVEFVTTLTAALRVPYARILVRTEDTQPVVAAEFGRPQPGVHTFPMVAHGEPVGTLEVAPRRPGENFTPAEHTLLHQLADQAAIAAQAHRLTLELQLARVVLVRAREEERLRLRHDLHDGLGPALAGTRMQLAAARGRLAADSDGQDTAVAAMLASALDVLADCTSEVRRLVDGLRPSALDRGLARALQQRAAALLAGHDVELDLPADLGELPAAVEVAAYRIATEAMTNVARHARARTCRLEVAVDAGALRVTVLDDGVGMTRSRDGGVGLESMTTRAEELGGVCMVIDAQPGTRIEALLPLRGH